jgi:hypothetical protein
MADRTPLINGQAYSWVDIVVNVLGVPIAGITEITYSEEAEITDNYGQGRRPVSRGHGKIEAEASMTIDRAEYNALIQAAPGKNLMNIPEFDIQVAYLPEGSSPTVDILKNVRFKSNKGGASEGDTNVMAELELVISHVEWDALS